MTTPTGEPVLTLQELRNAVALLERAALAAGASEETLGHRRPGGSAYPDESPGAWLSYHSWLSMQAAGAREAASGQRTLADVKRDAAGDLPIEVVLERGETVRVQPKSARALLVMRALDAEWRQVGPDLAALFEAAEPLPEAAAAAVWGHVFTAKSMQLWLWAACDGVDLPFDPEGPEPAAPAWTATLSALDLVRILEAHNQIHRLDLEILAQAFPQTGEERRARDMSDVLAAIASERHVSTASLFTGVTVRGLYHQALVAAIDADELRRKRVRAQEG